MVYRPKVYIFRLSDWSICCLLNNPVESILNLKCIYIHWYSIHIPNNCATAELQGKQTHKQNMKMKTGWCKSGTRNTGSWWVKQSYRKYVGCGCICVSIILRCIRVNLLLQHCTVTRQWPVSVTHTLANTQTVNQTSITNHSRDTALFADSAPLHLWPGQGACMSVGCGCVRYELSVSLKLVAHVLETLDMVSVTDQHLWSL